MAPMAMIRKSDPNFLSLVRTIAGTARGCQGLALMMGCCLLTATGAYGQEARSGALAISPSVGLTETLTDNVALASFHKQADLMSQLSASIRIASRAGRVQGNLDYTLTGVTYLRSREFDSLQNRLNAVAKADLIEKFLTIDGSAQVSQQAISAFGPQSVESGLINDNRTEVRSLQVIPKLSGTIAGALDYQASLAAVSTRSGAADNRGSGDSTQANVTIGYSKGPTLGWSSSLVRTHSKYFANRSTDQDMANVMVSYAPFSDWRFSASAGRETSNLTSRDKTSNATWGMSADWSPSGNIRLSGNLDHRFFGNAHRLNFEYRLPRSVFRLTSSRQVAEPSTQGGPQALGTAYDLFNSVFLSIEPDPVQRDLMVRNFLQKNGVDPNAQVANGYLASAATLDRRTEISYALQGVRSTLSFAYYDSRSNRLDRQSTASDDLSGTGSLHMRGYSLNVGHRLTPATGISFDWSRQAAGESTEPTYIQRVISLNLTTTFSERSTGGLMARHTSQESQTRPYSENALVATFGLRF